jgi:hypothetical protein
VTSVQCDAPTASGRSGAAAAQASRKKKARTATSTTAAAATATAESSGTASADGDAPRDGESLCISSINHAKTTAILSSHSIAQHEPTHAASCLSSFTTACVSQ